MPAATKPATKPLAERTADPAVEMTAWRFRFVETPPIGSEVLRRYSDFPDQCAVRETAADISEPPVWPAPVDSLQVVCAAEPGALASKLKSWIAKPQDSEAVTTIAIETEAGKLRWRPGRAVIDAAAEDCGDIIAGLVEFSFFEAQLRRLEQAIIPHQATADRDVALAYNIRRADRSQWDRLFRTIEELYHLRLQFARLEPNLYQSARTLPAGARRVIDRLNARADVEARLEALNDRLETIEDLYEGAIDRITDHRNYRKESVLEIAIVILLTVEVVLLLMHR